MKLTPQQMLAVAGAAHHLHEKALVTYYVEGFVSDEVIARRCGDLKHLLEHACGVVGFRMVPITGAVPK